ncbi:hypothetical protein [Endozoicomonas sp. 8E]|uniref:hypothetical protein n=1 Tax=Endozoicomonas sp. 8E TaxID=3035692 RepID=UPI0029393976|nr:hypothetical protein [Endozoicomonas sp. 8E]WOG27114.1 hypothetical protein P6910_21565 [Endozoicomonas sp. 8E]
MTEDNPLKSTPHSWLPLEVLVVIDWHLKRFWNQDSALFNPIELQAAPLLTQRGQPSATITIMFGSGYDQPQHQPTKSSDQQSPPATSQRTVFFSAPLNIDCGGGNRHPQQNLHSLDLNCYVYPCNGVCKYRPSPNSRTLDEWSLNSLERSTDQGEKTPGLSSCPHLANGYCFSCIGHFDPLNTTDFQQKLSFGTLRGLPDIQLQCVSGELSLAGNTDGKPANSMTMNAGAACTTFASRPLYDGAPIFGNTFLHSEATTDCQQTFSAHKKRVFAVKKSVT